MNAFEIKVALMREGISMRSIARSLGVSANAVSLVVNRRLASPRIRNAVARAIGREPADVFPEDAETHSREKIVR